MLFISRSNIERFEAFLSVNEAFVGYKVSHVINLAVRRKMNLISHIRIKYIQNDSFLKGIS